MTTAPLLEDRTAAQDLDAYVVAAAFAGPMAAFALGDGTLRLALPGGEWRTVEAHDGAILALASDRDGFLTGGDDGRLVLTGPDGTPTTLADLKGKWIEHVASHADAKSPLRACTAGKTVHVYAGLERLKSLDHPSTVTGLAFDGKGKRVGASHYNGASLWFVGAKVDTPRKLEWKGSHTGIAIHPAGDAVVTAMQENALHGWRLSDGQHMRMSGYPAKTESLSFSRTGKWLASSGADTVVIWPFFGGGPMGKPPVEMAGGDQVLCTRVAFQPQGDILAAAFADGLVVLIDVATERVLPLAEPGHGPVTALAWSANGGYLAYGTETGFAARLDLTAK